jgi:integrase
MLREHINQFGVGEDGRLFRTRLGGIYVPSTLRQVLQQARVRAFTPAQVASPLARRPYDLRHAGISWWLNAGIPATLVAEWAGNTVEVLYRFYAHCIEGDDERWLAGMEEALGGYLQDSQGLVGDT